jgi:NAD+ synthase (glutamine-hydrolysing)
MSLRVALGQFDAIVGGLDANIKKMQSLYENALEKGVELLVFPELATSGYPPEDLLLKKHYYIDNLISLERLAIQCPKIPMLVGFPQQQGKKTYNAAALLQNGTIQKVYRKCLLPNYGVFDERRYFSPGSSPAVITIKNTVIALTICEDIWDMDWLADFLKPVLPVDLLINISASPFNVGKISTRQQILANCAHKLNCAVAYCNLVGGQDELVFDGRSMLAESDGTLAMQAKPFAQDLLIAEVGRQGSKIVVSPANGVGHKEIEKISPVEEVYKALVLGTRDYVLKNNFKHVVIGLSGGIDSALTAAIAVDALGAENVAGVTMPSQFNSPDTISDAEIVAKNLGIEFHTIPIGTILENFDKTLGKLAGWTNAGLAYENLQARIRGSILMSLSNQFGWLVLTTGNKSETAVGYSTLYGDTAGGFAVIKDVPKTLVYRLCDYINRIKQRDVIPQSVLSRAPSAELRPNQKDADSLPEYDLLDPFLNSLLADQLAYFFGCFLVSAVGKFAFQSFIKGGGGNKSISCRIVYDLDIYIL